MILVILLIGAILVVSAVRDTYGALFTALGVDIPAFVVWAAAIIALGAIGYVPGLKPVSRGLLALVLIVLILRNYANILTGFKSVSNGSGASASGGTGTAATGGGSTGATGSNEGNADYPSLTITPGPQSQVTQPAVAPQSGPSAQVSLSWPTGGFGTSGFGDTLNG